MPYLFKRRVFWASRSKEYESIFNMSTLQIAQGKHLELYPSHYFKETFWYPLAGYNHLPNVSHSLVCCR